MVAVTREDTPYYTNWIKFAEHVQMDSSEGRLIEEATCQTVILIRKWTDEFREIGLVEVIWKIVIVNLNCRLGLAITFHGIIYGFHYVIGTGTTYLDTKLPQYLEAMR